MTSAELHEFLNQKVEQYNAPIFIDSDPIFIPHLFAKKEDIEIAGFLAATIAWGQRKTIISNAKKLMQWMDHSPHEFILNFKKQDLKPFKKFVHRTFNGEDCIYFLTSLKNIYTNHAGLENAFRLINSKSMLEGLPFPIGRGAGGGGHNSIKDAITHFRQLFFEIHHPSRTLKHISNPTENSAAKRINMFLRWMVRNDKKGVDFGIWKKIKPSQLYCPLDVHSGNVARKLGILTRKQNDWKAVDELTQALRKLDPKDPVKYDFALFGLGVFEGFEH